MTVLEVRGIAGGYASADEIVKGVSLSVGRGEIAAMIGPNGAGKSTCLKLIAGLLRLRAGVVTLAGERISHLSATAIARKGVAFVPQERNVFGTLTVEENLDVGGSLDRRAAVRRKGQILARYPMLAAKRHKPAQTLSGGQRQILAMAAALMVEPRVLLLDEPTAGLAPKAAAELFDTIAGIASTGVAIVMVEQNALEALRVANTAYVLVLGQTTASGRAADLARNREIGRMFLGV
jgi:branched-chain amino acid transport system ATP-binding protein/neutral amino acid transport system ATP-binding protein